MDINQIRVEENDANLDDDYIIEDEYYDYENYEEYNIDK